MRLLRSAFTDSLRMTLFTVAKLKPPIHQDVSPRAFTVFPEEGQTLNSEISRAREA